MKLCVQGLSMADQKEEGIKGEDDAVPIAMYSIQSELPANIVIPETAGTYIPYTVTTVTNLNPCAEGLEDPVFVPSISEKNEGKDENNGAAGGGRGPKPKNTPTCCRRYLCCFPLIIVTVIWLMMFSSQNFEHCRDCLSLSQYTASHTLLQFAIISFCTYCGWTAHPTINTLARTTKVWRVLIIIDEIQICCISSTDTLSECHKVAYPEGFDYSLGTYFTECMWMALILMLAPCCCPFAVPLMMYKDLRRKAFSWRRQSLFDLFCTICFLCSVVACSRTIYEYYRFPQNRCSTNSELFGIKAGNGGGDILSSNTWIMSQTTYSSFFAMILLFVFGLCGGVTLCIQSVITCKRRKRMKRDNEKIAEPAKVERVKVRDMIPSASLMGSGKNYSFT